MLLVLTITLQNIYHANTFALTSQEIPKNSQKNSKRIPKESQKNSQRFPQRILKILKTSHMRNTLHLLIGRKPFRSCFLRMFMNHIAIVNLDLIL